ncbi:ester cyclase [Streptomyces sp. NPDC056656]|uniref:ester cyclase n=1 Tax=Streptomyces sp. NPDC056656 TaxID=3345895 RepID=UPI0036BB1B96
MGDARDVLNRLNAEVNTARDHAVLRDLYAPDAVLTSPNWDDVRGPDGAIAYLSSWTDAFPDVADEPVAQYEIGNVAINQYITRGTHTRPLVGQSGTTVPPTGNSFELRTCDIIVVADGRIVQHHIYLDVADWFGQLGLMPESPI